MWFLETAWPPIIILLLLSAIFLTKWKESQKKNLLITSICLILLTPGIYILEKSVVTEKEVLEQNVYDLTDSFQQREIENVLKYFHEKDIKDRAMVENSLTVLSVENDLRITDFRINISGDGLNANTHFRANASIQFRGNDLGYRPSRWMVKWEKIENKWLITNVDQLDPIKGSVIRSQISSFNTKFRRGN